MRTVEIGEGKWGEGRERTESERQTDRQRERMNE